MWRCKEWWNIQLTLGIWCGPWVAITAAAEKTLGIKLKQKPCVNKKIILTGQAATRFIKIRKTKDKPLYEKKQINRKNSDLVNTEETNKMGKQIEKIKKSKDDWIRIFNTIKY